ncbi:MAG: hypothetical protein II966_08470, partial [Lachnospiraceae bacterium]|nr:hypothetical protein [Lachnospiraceae bacterium]
MKRSRRKIIVAVLLVTLLSQTLYGAAASVFGLGTRSYAYADDEYADEVEPGQEVDSSTQDDKDVVQPAPDGSSYEDGEESPASDSDPVDNNNDVGEGENNIAESSDEAEPDIRLRASYVDSETGSEIKDTEELEIEPDYLYVIKDEASEIEDHTYSKTTINIGDKEYDVTAIRTENRNGTEVFLITTDEDPSADSRWTRLIKDAVVVHNYDEIKEDTDEDKKEEEDKENKEDKEEKEEEKEPAKRVYEYEDNYVYAKATLEKADAIPDDAEFIVKDVTGSKDADDALTAADDATEQNLDLNTARVYDIHFENEELGEIEPEAGSVRIELSFKQNIIKPE